MSRKKVTKAVIPTAGLGTRFLPATKAQPKEMLPIVDTPTIQFVVEEAVQSGIRDILIITTPIYNFSVPATLKAWIDLVARARATFRYSEEGSQGLLRDKHGILFF